MRGMRSYAFSPDGHDILEPAKLISLKYEER